MASYVELSAHIAKVTAAGKGGDILVPQLCLVSHIAED